MAPLNASRFPRILGRTTVPWTIALVGMLAAGAASAQDMPLFTKAEVESMFGGKTLKYVRASDSRTMVFDIRSGGKVYYSPPQTMRNLSIEGSWVVEDDGALCFKWESDKYVAMQNGCYKFRHAGDKVRIVGGRNPDNLIGDVVP